MPCPQDARAGYPRRFRRLLSPVAQAFQPAAPRFVRTSNTLHQTVQTVRPFDAMVRPCDPWLFLPLRASVSIERAANCATTMASADFCRPIVTPRDVASPWAGRQISQGKTRDFPPTYPPHIRRLDPDDIGLQVYAPPRPSRRRLVCGSCSSGQEFAFRFLQIPRRHGHPCGSARSSCHQGLHRDFHPTSHIPVRFRSPVQSVRS